MTLHVYTGLQVSPEEAAALLKGFFDQSDLQTQGLKIGGIKYTYLRQDDGLLLGKLKEGGCSIAKTKQSKNDAHNFERNYISLNYFSMKVHW